MNYPYRNPRVLTDIPQPAPDSRLVLNHETGRYLRLGLREFEWLTRLNGQIHVQNVAAELGVDEHLVDELLSRLAAAKLICFSEEPVTVLPVKPAVESQLETRRVEWTQFGQLRIHLSQPKVLLERLSPVTRLLMSRSFVGAGLLLVLLGILLAASEGGELVRVLRDFQWTAWQAVAVVGLLFATTVVHEFGHALVCHSFGAPVRSLGVMIYYLQPAAYADITDSWQLSNRWQRVAISFAGVYVQAIITSLAIGLWLALRSMGHAVDLLVVFILLNVSMMAFNLIPFVKLDGYWMLSNILGIANLRDRAMEWVRASFVATLTRRPVDGKRLRYNAVLAMAPLDRILLAGFGITSMMFGISMWVGGIGFLFRVSRWLGIEPRDSIFAVGGALAVLAVAYVARLLLARRQARRSRPVGIPRPPESVGAIVAHTIDPQRPIRLNPHLSAMDDGTGAITFAWSTPDALTVQVPREFFDLLPRLREGTATLQELKQLNLWSVDVERALQRLWHERHLRYASEWEVPAEQARYSRQLGWFSMNAAARGKEFAVQARLRDASVAILGVGGLGTHVAWNLAACGIGSLHLVDGDLIELTNLNRQLFYTPADIGLRKVEVAARRLVEFNPQVQVRTTHKYLESPADIVEAIRGASFVVRALDSPQEALAWVNESCVRRGIPYLGAGFFPQGTIVGPTVIPGVTACLACNQREEAPRFDRATGGTLGPLVSFTASLLASEVITFLGQLGNVQTAGRMIAISAPTLAFSVLDTPLNEQCPVCGRVEEARRASA